MTAAASQNVALNILRRFTCFVFLFLFAEPSARGISLHCYQANLVTINQTQIKHPAPEYQSSKSAIGKQSNTKCIKWIETGTKESPSAQPAKSLVLALFSPPLVCLPTVLTAERIETSARGIVGNVVLYPSGPLTRTGHADLLLWHAISY